MSTLEEISKKTGMVEHSCQCPTCQLACRRVPCLGTPADILQLIIAGHGDKISLTYWAVGKIWGIHPDLIVMYQLRDDDYGCVMFAAGKCGLHAQGLKPTEGKLSTHVGENVLRLPVRRVSDRSVGKAGG